MQTTDGKGAGNRGAGGADSARSLPSEGAVIESAALFCGRREITIHHEGSLYRMKITRQGKLILNK